MNSDQAALQLLVESSGEYWIGQKEAPKTKLHMYGKDDIQIMVYSMRRLTRKRDQKKTKRKD